jgi:hypothetical protein
VYAPGPLLFLGVAFRSMPRAVFRRLPR